VPLARLCAVFFSMLAMATLARAEMLPDSTATDAWRLSNGLEVRVHHVPRAAGVAIVVAYRAGSAYEPAGAEGLSELLAQLQFTGPAGDIPARTREEMDSLRPLGWGLRTNAQLVVMTEIASSDHFPGVLRQVATRMKGVGVTDADLKASLATVRRDLATRGFGRPELGLYYRVRDLAHGLDDAAILHRSSGHGLDGATLKVVSARLHAMYVPANASLGLAGDFSQIDVRALVEQEFGSIPGGTAQAEVAARPLRPGTRSALWPGLEHPLGVVGIFAPALEDSLHPAFFLGALLMGGWFRDQMGPPRAPLVSRFQYSLLDEPDLLRLYPTPSEQETDAGALSAVVNRGLDQVSGINASREQIEAMRFNVDWLLGGLIPPGVLQQCHTQTGALGTLASSMATRALWHGDGFWDAYRARFEHTLLGHNAFTEWMQSPAHQIALLFRAKS